LTLTVSKKTFHDEREQYEKHKVFLYKEDFEKFTDKLNVAIAEIQKIKSEREIDTEDSVAEYSSVTFEEL
jgi:hypothetical protein